MPDLKVFTLAAMGAFVTLPAFAQEAPAPEEAEEPEEICRTFEEFTDYLESEHGEVVVMEQPYYGPEFEPGDYKLYVNPQTGGWSAVFNPYAENPPDSACQDDDHVFQIDGDNSGYPYKMQGRPWYKEIFDAPTFL